MKEKTGRTAKEKKEAAMISKAYQAHHKGPKRSNAELAKVMDERRAARKLMAPK
jgi:hypothetical protein